MDLKIKNKEYEFVKKRTYVNVRVFRCGEEFLRIGPKSVLDPEIALHTKLLKMGFPVPKIKSKGMFKGERYFTEESLGEKHFGQIFAEDMKKLGRVSDRNFTAFVSISVKFAEAQIRAGVIADKAAFENAIHYRRIQKELPEFKAEIQLAFKKIFSKLEPLPYVMTHGDYGPFNIYPKGVIDFASASVGPIGYDLVSASCMTEFFPRGNKHEFNQLFVFTPEQKAKYFNSMDKLFVENNLPKLSEFEYELMLCRCIWVAARMEKHPRIQAWRYKQLKRLIKTYLKNN